MPGLLLPRPRENELSLALLQVVVVFEVVGNLIVIRTIARITKVQSRRVAHDGAGLAEIACAADCVAAELVVQGIDGRFEFTLARRFAEQIQLTCFAPLLNREGG